MPSGPITVVLNSNNNKKIAIVRPPSVAGDSVATLKQTILHEARNKFRIKTLHLLFLKGGRAIQDDDPVEIIPDQVFVSKGEPYCGPISSSRPVPAEVCIIKGKSYIDSNAIKQLENLSVLDGVKMVVGLPDLHPGDRFPIGCAVVSEGIYPALVGSDVGCGIGLYHLASPSKSSSNPKKLANLLWDLEEPWAGGSVNSWLQRYGIERTSSFDSSLGTIGGGNHFAEICTLEQIVDQSAAEELGIVEGSLYLLVHTGSRGLGASILASQTAAESNPYLPPDSTVLTSYLEEHDYAVKWAVANRDLVAHRVKECLFSPERGDSSDRPTIELEKILDVTHNSVTKQLIERGEEVKELWVHRKGAAPHDKGIIPCPGSRGDFSWLLKPIGNGQYSAHSLAHGAGRRFARSVLHARHKQHSSTSLTTTKLGSEVICTNENLLIEEKPEAYKDISVVVEDMENSGVCQAVVKLRPVVTYKLREAGR